MGEYNSFFFVFNMLISRLSRSRIVSFSQSRYLSSLPALTTPIAAAKDEKFAELKPEETQVTKLKNGVRVATLERHGNVSCIQVFVGSGSRNEKPEQRGATHVLSNLLLQSTTEKTAFRLTREAEQAGISASAHSFRDALVYGCEVLRPCSVKGLRLVSDSLLKPALLPWEVKNAIAASKAEHDGLSKNPQALIVEHLHTAAYSGQTLGAPLYVQKQEYDALTPEAINQYLHENLTGGNVCVVGTNVIHDDFVDRCTELFEHLPAGKAATQAANYTGGDLRIESENPLSHVAFAFEGVPWSSDQIANISVLSKLLGGGSSFSAGGPGKGTYSRLYQYVLAEYNETKFAHAYQIMYSDSGLFGVVGSVSKGKEYELSNLLANALVGLKHLDEEEVARSKLQLKAGVATNLENRSIATDDFGRQILAYNKRFSPQELYAMIDKVDLKSLQKTVNRLFQSPLTVVAQGETRNVPAYGSISSALTK
eukprot:c19045_g2_i2.p1 GENE.c19045_g2_i2~~c19045_g2_i2.p1  ORF type:complete len:482 (+),score=148.55 c19045_g2_i2:1-1446(+)